MNIKCLAKGHDIACRDGKDCILAHQKGQREWALFSGRLYYCIRKDCKYEAYVGPRRSYRKVMISIRDGLYELDGRRYKSGPIRAGVQVLWPVAPK